jgi:hypothetical protein
MPSTGLSFVIAEPDPTAKTGVADHVPDEIVTCARERLAQSYARLDRSALSIRSAQEIVRVSQQRIRATLLLLAKRPDTARSVVRRSLNKAI